MSVGEWIIQLAKIVLASFFGLFFLWWSFEVLGLLTKIWIELAI